MKNFFEGHQVAIARKTLRMSDTGVKIMGGMTKEEARQVLRSVGWTDERIKKWEGVWNQ